MSRRRALVWWSRENKVGIESINNVPTNSQFEGAATSVMFSGDKKYYPAKIIMISDDAAALEKRSGEIEAEIEKQKEAAAAAAVASQAQDVPRSRRKSAGKSTGKMGAASDRAIATAVGGKPPVPRDLELAHQAARREKKDAQTSLNSSQVNADKRALSKVKQNLIPAFNTAVSNESNPSHDSDVDDDLMGESDDERNKESGSGDGGSHTENQTVEKWCMTGCKPCEILKKYDKPEFQSFLNELSTLFNGDTTSKKCVRFLDILPTKEGVKKVELAVNTGVYIAESVKDQLKVDYRNKPAALARETLFAVYGREAFQTVVVTGKGTKEGTFTVPDPVLKAVISFVNKYVDKDKKMTTSKMVSLINKRAPEWRKSQSPQDKSKRKRRQADETTPGKEKTAQAVGTSPFKVTPVKENMTPQLSPVKSPLLHRSPFKSPITQRSHIKSPIAKRSPIKSPAKSHCEPASFESVMAALQGTSTDGSKSHHEGEFSGTRNLNESSLAASVPPMHMQGSGMQWNSQYPSYPPTWNNGQQQWPGYESLPPMFSPSTSAQYYNQHYNHQQAGY